MYNIFKSLNKMVANIFDRRSSNKPVNKTKEILTLFECLSNQQIELEKRNSELIQTQILLQKEIDKYIDLFEFAPVGYFTVDNTGVVLNVNTTGASMLGFVRNSLLGKKISSFIRSEDRENFSSAFNSIIKNHNISPIEFRMIKKNGVELIVFMEAALIKDEENHQQYIRLIINDVTARKEAEEQIIQKEYLDSLYLGSVLPMFIVNVDENGKFTYSGINPAYEQTTGIKNEDIKGIALDDFPGLNEEDKELIKSNYNRCINCRRTIQYREKIYLYDKETYWLTTLTPLIDRNDNVYRIIGTSMYINDLVKTYRNLEQQKDDFERIANKKTKELEEKEKQSQMIFTTANSGFWDWKVNSEDIYLSPEWKRLLGYEDFEIENKISSLLSFLHPDDANSIADIAGNYINDPKKHYSSKFRIKHKNGSYRWFFNSAVSMRNKDGQIVRLFGTHTDITVLQNRAQDEETIEVKVPSNEKKIFVVNKNFEIEFINNAGARYFHETPDRIVGKKINNLFMPEIAEQQINILNKVFRREDNYPGNIRVEFPFNPKRLEMELIPLRSSTQEIISIICISYHNF